MLTSEFHLNLKAHQPHLISLVLAIKSQCQTALPASKAIAQTEPKGNKTEPVEKLLKNNSFAGLPLTWKTWKSQGIWKRPLKVREFVTELPKSGNFVVWNSFSAKLKILILKIFWGACLQTPLDGLTPSRWNCKFTWCHRYHMCHVNRDSLTHCSQGSVAQLVEQRTSNPKVVGSNPTWATEFFNNSVGHYQCRLSSLMLPWGWF